MRRSYLSFGCAFILIMSGCGSTSKQLREGERAYQSAHYEDAIIWFEAIERDAPKMSGDDRVRYHYYRGMSAYRLSDRDEALYHLSLARELAEYEKGALDAGAVEELNGLLGELTPKGANARVDSGGENASAKEEERGRAGGDAAQSGRRAGAPE